MLSVREDSETRDEESKGNNSGSLGTGPVSPSGTISFHLFSLFCRYRPTVKVGEKLVMYPQDFGTLSRWSRSW